MVQIDQVNFTYSGEEASPNLKNLRLTIHPGECILLCGSSGCGKTTVTKLINGLIPHFDEGELQGRTLVDGMVVAETSPLPSVPKGGLCLSEPQISVLQH